MNLKRKILKSNFGLLLVFIILVHISIITSNLISNYYISMSGTQWNFCLYPVEQPVELSRYFQWNPVEHQQVSRKYKTL